MKDNLAKRKWGEINIVLSAMHKRQSNIFSLCHVAQFVWRCVFFAFNIPPPHNAKNIFSNWLRKVSRSIKKMILIEVSVVCWSIWRCRNDKVFNGYLHVFLLAPLLVYNATTGVAGYYAQWCYTLGIGSQGSLIPLWVA
uniref:Reverse transcriptase zinc-binding domain-containing protein n=1 Tax=Oryza barthii TaxID=65489 RepID=A0A0D3GMK9_9ORYZ